MLYKNCILLLLYATVTVECLVLSVWYGKIHRVTNGNIE